MTYSFKKRTHCAICTKSKGEHTRELWLLHTEVEYKNTYYEAGELKITEAGRRKLGQVTIHKQN